MYEKILVPLDGSKAAEIVIPYVEEIAAKLGSEIILVSVAEPKTGDTEHLQRSYLEPIAEQVQRQLKEWGSKEEVKVQSKALLGKPADGILHSADENNVGLIAMTSRGSSVRGHWLLGNIAAKVLRAASQPMLLIRAPASQAAIQQKRLIRRILVPLDGSHLGESAIPYTESLASALAAELVVFQVMPPVATWGAYEGYPSSIPPPDPESRKASAIAYLDGVAKPLKEKGLSISSAVNLGSAPDQIIDYAKANAIDLIAMSTHGRSGIGRWVFGSVTDKVLHAGDTAVLVVPPAKARRTVEHITEESKEVEISEVRVTKAYFLFTAGGPLVILTSYDSIDSPELLKRLAAKGIPKFIAREIPMDLAKARYGPHFDIVIGDVRETDDLRILDFNGERILRNFRFKELGIPILHEPE